MAQRILITRRRRRVSSAFLFDLRLWRMVVINGFNDSRLSPPPTTFIYCIVNFGTRNYGIFFLFGVLISSGVEWCRGKGYVLSLPPRRPTAEYWKVSFSRLTGKCYRYFVRMTSNKLTCGVLKIKSASIMKWRRGNKYIERFVWFFLVW